MDKLHVIIIILLIVIVFLILTRNEPFEHMTDNSEAIRNIATVYNTEKITVNNLATTKDASVGGSLTANGPISFLPKGSIIIWYGDHDTVPIGWQLCDGTNSTPNLQSKFVYGAQKGTQSGQKSHYKNSGGEEDHILTINEMPAHHHNITTGSGEGCTPGGRVTQWAQCSGPYVKDDGIIRDNGGSQSHNNMPPWLSLYYIMKMV